MVKQGGDVMGLRLPGVMQNLTTFAYGVARWMKRLTPIPNLNEGYIVLALTQGAHQPDIMNRCTKVAMGMADVRQILLRLQKRNATIMQIPRILPRGCMIKPTKKNIIIVL